MISSEFCKILSEISQNSYLYSNFYQEPKKKEKSALKIMVEKLVYVWVDASMTNCARVGLAIVLVAYWFVSFYGIVHINVMVL